MRGIQNINKITLFLAITFVLVAVVYVPIILTGALEGLSTLALMWSPGIAALLTQWLTTRSVRGLGWRWGETRYQVISFLIPLLLCVVVYGLAWGVGLVPFTAAGLVALVAEATGRTMSLPLALLVVLLGVLPGTLLGAMGEEIGWRGLLVPELAKRYRFAMTALVSGVIWVIFHVPAILFADYNSGAPLWYALTMFALMAIGASFVFAWLRLKSGSLWTAVILHTSHNLFVQGIFDPMTLDFGLTPYLTTEFGAGLALAYGLLAFYFWRRRGEVEAI
ncbi:MAG: CPBP family intramembrane metalloprotease [Caldilineaceae bacterium]|nr:CPBP family intramembrane metalloprotease [Caldilineaceae bacterium]